MCATKLLDLIIRFKDVLKYRGDQHFLLKVLCIICYFFSADIEKYFFFNLNFISLRIKYSSYNWINAMNSSRLEIIFKKKLDCLKMITSH